MTTFIILKPENSDNVFDKYTLSQIFAVVPIRTETEQDDALFEFVTIPNYAQAVIIDSTLSEEELLKTCKEFKESALYSQRIKQVLESIIGFWALFEAEDLERNMMLLGRLRAEYSYYSLNKRKEFRNEIILHLKRIAKNFFMEYREKFKERTED